MTALGLLGIAVLAAVGWSAMQFAIWLAHKLNHHREEW